MRGLTVKEYNKIIKFATINNTSEVLGGNGKTPNIKYIDSSFDSRTCTYWKVHFWGFGSNYEFSVPIIRPLFKYDSLFDLIMAFLKNKMKDEELSQYIKND